MSVAATEQITLDSGEVNIRPTQHHLNTITLEMLQINSSQKLQRLFRVYDDKILSVTEKSRKKKSSVLINMIMLDETPKRKRSINMAYFFTAIGFGAAAFLTYYLKSRGVGFLSSPYVYAVVGILGCTAAFLMALMIKNIENVLIFKSRHGSVPVVKLFHNNPDKKQYQAVISQLMEKIAAVKARYPVPESRLLPAELGEHRRLRDEGFISEEHYNIAKARILGNHSPR